MPTQVIFAQTHSLAPTTLFVPLDDIVDFQRPPQQACARRNDPVLLGLFSSCCRLASITSCALLLRFREGFIFVLGCDSSGGGWICSFWGCGDAVASQSAMADILGFDGLHEVPARTPRILVLQCPHGGLRLLIACAQFHKIKVSTATLMQ